MRLLPREEKFYGDFIEQVKVIQEAATVLCDAVVAGNSHMAAAATRIRSLEQKGDELTHAVFTRLNSTFITPIDPEDIHSLASHLDDVLDGIEEVAYCLVAYRVESIPAGIQDMAGMLVTCVQAMDKAFQALAEDKKMIEHCIEINRLEDMADQVYRTEVSRLFVEEKDALTVIKLKEIYDNLEATMDRCEDVADVLQGVIVKNS